jgi:hypothetical protein
LLEKVVDGVETEIVATPARPTGRISKIPSVPPAEITEIEVPPTEVAVWNN